jgi:hypothetical protein
MQFRFAQNRVYGTSARADGRSPASPLMLLYNNVAELRQFRGWKNWMWRIGTTRP